MACRPQGGWQFVNIVEPKKQKKDEDIRKLVRANAMRDFRKKQKEERQAAAHARGQPNNKDHRAASRHHHTDSDELEIVSQKPVSVCRNDKPWRDEAYFYGAAQLKQLLHNLESMSMDELNSTYEEELAEHIQQTSSYPDTNMRTLREAGWVFSSEYPPAGLIVNPKTLLDSGVDPFNAAPVFGNARYTTFVVHHFATVMARNCLPLGKDAGQNPLVNIWLPLAISDPALFFSTLCFAAVHIDILTGRKKNVDLLLRKSDTIKTINEKLQCPDESLSDSTIGSVAMLAATESIQGNYQELRIHMNALTKMVRLRGGLQELSPTLHMFISWQDLLFSAILAQPPTYKPVACSNQLRDNMSLRSLGLSDPPAYPELASDPVVFEQLQSLLADLRYLTETINKHEYGGAQYSSKLSTLDLMTFSKNRTAVEHRILNMARSPSTQKPRDVMTRDDYTLELCRLAALIYLKCGLHMFLPMCSILVSLKEQIMQLTRDGEKYRAIGISGKVQPGCATWGLFMASLLSSTPEEEEFFASRIAKGTRSVGGRTWADMEMLLKRIAWVDKLRTRVCKSVWARVEADNALVFYKQGMVDSSTQWLGATFNRNVLDYDKTWNAQLFNPTPTLIQE